MNSKPRPQASKGLNWGAVVGVLSAVAIMGVAAWLLARTPDVWGWPAVWGFGALGIVVALVILHGIYEIRQIRRIVAESLQGRPRVTDEEFGKQFYTPDTAPVAVRLRRLLAENLECELSGLIPSDDFAKWLELFPGVDSAADCFFEETAIEFQLRRDAPWPDRFESFDTLVKFVVQHSQRKNNAPSMVVNK